VIQDGYRSQQNSRSLLLSVGLLFSLTIAVALIVQASPRLERALSFKVIIVSGIGAALIVLLARNYLDSQSGVC
jgi:hypothetical protein